MDKDTLIRMYKVENQQPKQIAAFFDVPVHKIRNLFTKYNIPANREYSFDRPLIGQKFNRWKYLGDYGVIGTVLYWNCECECGTLKKVSYFQVKSGGSKSCGCYHRDRARETNWTGYKEISGTYWQTIKTRQNSRGRLPFNITIKYAWSIYENQKGKCALSGLPIVFETKDIRKPDKHIASLDRINCNIGYIKDNIQWVVREVNYMKRTMTDEQLIFFCKQIAKYND